MNLIFIQLNPDGQNCLTEKLNGRKPGGVQQEQGQGQPSQQRRQSQHHLHNNKGQNNHQQQVCYIIYFVRRLTLL